MTYIVTVTCDSCGATKPADKDPEQPWWDFQYTSMDFPLPGGGAEFKSGSWDLCPACSHVAYEVLVAAVGKPHRDSDPLP